MRAVLYARVSSAVQRDRHTIASQLTELPGQVERQGWELVAPATAYVDDGRSARSGQLEKREAFTRLLADARAGRFDVIAVVHLNRITRADDHAEIGFIVGALQKAKVALWTPGTGLHRFTGGIEDIVTFVHLLSGATENRTRNESFARGKREAARRGQKPGGASPYGYTWAKGARDGSGWGVDEARAAIVREIFRRLVAGETCNAIAFDLEARGVPPPRRGRWHMGVSRVVQNPTYRGTLAYGEHRIPVPRLVDDATWFAAQAQLGDNKLRGLRRTKRTYLCEGLLVCGLCGARIYIHRESSALVRGRSGYYTCQQRRRPNPARGARCTLPMTQTHQVDGDVWQEIARFLTQPRADLLEALGAHRAGALAESSAWEQDLASATKQLEQLESAELAIMDRFRRQLISETAMDRHLRDVSARRALLQHQISSARAANSAITSRSSAADSLAVLVDSIRARLPRLTAEERRELVQALVAPGGLVLSGNEVRVRLWFGQVGVGTGWAGPTCTDDGVARPCTGDASLPCNRERDQGAGIELRVAVGGKNR